MNRYTTHCTEEQTKKALELGAPVKKITFARPMDGQEIVILDGDFYLVPTAEQMIGWLRSKNIEFHFDDETNYWSIERDIENAKPFKWYNYSDKKELDAIDAALGELSKEK